LILKPDNYKYMKNFQILSHNDPIFYTYSYSKGYMYTGCDTITITMSHSVNSHVNSNTECVTDY